jgi:F420H(2)-dependent quinone reductase
VTPEAEAALRMTEEIEVVTTGRRSGRPHAVTLWSAYQDGALWLRTDSDADWYRNLLADPRCRVRFGERDVEGRYEPIADHQQGLRQLIGLWRKKYGNEWVGDWYVERGRIPVLVRIVNTA